MKEYRSRNSGRYVFNEDMHNLQELALSPVELFRDCGLDFVISGCNVSVSVNNDIYTIDVTSGYVYLDGKIRKVPAFSGTTANISTIGIYATQPTAPQITYFNGDTDYMYNDYASEVKVNFENTGEAACIMAQLKGADLYAFPNLRTAFFNHYCIMNNGTIGHVDSLSASVINTVALSINDTNINDIFVKKSGGTLNNNATLTLVKGNNNTVISGESISVDGTISAENISLSGHAIVTGNVTASSFIKTGGTSSQFLKADGSIDNTVYATNDRADTINARFNNYLLLTGGTLTGELIVNSTCLISGLLTLQAGLVGVNADLTGYVKAQKLEAIGELKAATGGITGALTAGSATINGAISAGSAQITSTVTIGTTLTVSGSATAEKFIKSGGTSSQFLKANGDVDTNSYALASSLNNYLLLTGGTLSGNLTVNNANVTATKFIKTGGTSSQFLKANGDVDSNAYLPLTGGTITGNVTALKFIVTNGQSNQFLKADGTIDSNTYLTTTSATSTYLTKSDAASTYLPLTGGVVTGALTINATLTTLSTVFLGGNTTVDGIITASQFKVPDRTGFLKANGSIDTSTYLTTNDASNTYLSKTDAASNYLTKTDAANTYQTRTGSSSDYLSKSDASNTYLSKTDASSIYLTNNSAISTYLSKTDAQTKYMPIGANGGGTITAADNYNAQTNILTLRGNQVSLQSNGKEFSMIMNGREGRFYFYSSTPMTLDNTVYVNGNLSVSGTIFGTVNSSSDESLKDIISEVSLSPEQIANAPAIKFKWKNDGNKTHVGTIAQYWKEILPEVVENNENCLTLAYSHAAMISVISLAKEVVALKQEIAELKGQTN